MFSKSKSALNNELPTSQSTNNGTFSVIGADVAITGSLIAQGDLHIDGSIEGDVQCKCLALGESGRIKGSIIADDADISGEVRGPVQARNLTLEKTARVQGDLSYENLIMHAGARPEGRLSFKQAETGLKLIASQSSE